MSNPNDLFGGEFFPPERAQEIALDWTERAFEEHELFSKLGHDPFAVAEAQYNGQFSMSNINNRESETGVNAFDFTTFILPEGIMNDVLLDPDVGLVDNLAGMVLHAAYSANRNTHFTPEDMQLVRPRLSAEEATAQFAASRIGIARQLLEGDEYCVKIMQLGRSNISASSVTLVRQGVERCNLAFLTRQIHLDAEFLIRDPAQ